MPIEEALKILKDGSKAKFVEAIDVAVRLGVDAKKSDQQVRGSTVLPAGTGKSVRVAVFAPAGAKADEALAAGAEAVGMDDLAEKMQRRRPELRRGHRHPGRDARGRQARSGAGPARPDAEPEGRHRVAEPGRSRSQCQGRPGALPHRQGRHHPLHHRQGRASTNDALKGNLQALLVDLVKAKPATSKGTYLQKVSISSTMGAGVTVDQSSLSLK